MPSKTVLVVGGAGFIGSHVNKMLYQAGYRTIVLDNLSTGTRSAVIRGTFIQGDLADSACLDFIFTNHQIDAVMHFAALIDVGESMRAPAAYYRNNVANTLNLLEAMYRHRIPIFIFSSSAAIFGSPQTPFINENHPCHPINPYGETKWMLEKMLRDFELAYGMKFSCLRYFNAAGGDPDGEIKNFKKKETNLIPLVLRSLKDSEGFISIYGTDYPTPDGTCIRDYIHVNDIGDAHIRAMHQLFEGAPSEAYNLGNGLGFSVRQVIEKAEIVTGRPLRVVETNRRPGDPPVLVANADKAVQKLGWIPQYPDLETMIAHAWQALQ